MKMDTHQKSWDVSKAETVCKWENSHLKFSSKNEKKKTQNQAEEVYQWKSVKWNQRNNSEKSVK